ncbi:ferredoxin [Streptomyces sp. NPDC005271]|uniref:ferredoxin n=1 Tax=unclassified Streptomyces TaxID=2593676 RepID=UPI0033B2269E
MGDRWRIGVDGGACVGSGMCVSTAPGGFRLEGARQSWPVATEADASEAVPAAAEAVPAAAEGCPVEAIAIRLLGSGEPVFPPDE